MTTLAANIFSFGGGTTAQLVDITTPIPVGVMTIATDTGIIKVGDGVTLYNALPVFVTLANLTNLSAIYARAIAATDDANNSATRAANAAVAAGASANQASAAALNSAVSAAAALAETNTVSSSIAALSGQIAGITSNLGTGGTTGGATAANQTSELTQLDAINVNTGSIVTELITANNDLGSILAKLDGTLSVSQTTALPAGSNTIGATTSPPSTLLGTMTLTAATNTALSSANVTMAPNSAALPVAGAFGILTIINTGANPAYISWFGGTASTSDGCELLAAGASDTFNLAGSTNAPACFSPSGTTLTFHN